MLSISSPLIEPQIKFEVSSKGTDATFSFEKLAAQMLSKDTKRKERACSVVVSHL